MDHQYPWICRRERYGFEQNATNLQLHVAYNGQKTLLTMKEWERRVQKSAVSITSPKAKANPPMKTLLHLLPQMNPTASPISAVHSQKGEAEHITTRTTTAAMILIVVMIMTPAKVRARRASLVRMPTKRCQSGRSQRPEAFESESSILPSPLNEYRHCYLLPQCQGKTWRALSPDHGTTCLEQTLRKGMDHGRRHDEFSGPSGSPTVTGTGQWDILVV